MTEPCACTPLPCLCVEQRLWGHPDTALFVSIDEAARGCLAGPVVAAAIRFCSTLASSPERLARLSLVNDSKQLSEPQRAVQIDAIRSEALDIGIGTASPQEIDQLNILGATQLAMQRAIEAAGGAPHALVDGQPLPRLGVPHSALPKADARCKTVAAASILAKQYQVGVMNALDCECPEYGFARHKGYGTEAHRAAIERHGLSIHHRRSFNAQMSLFS